MHAKKHACSACILPSRLQKLWCSLCTRTAAKAACTQDAKGIAFRFVFGNMTRVLRRLCVLQRAPSSRELGSMYCEHVPTFLPAVPDQHTLKSSPASENLVKMPDVSFFLVWVNDHEFDIIWPSMSPSQKVTSAPGLLKAARQVTENDVSYINVTVSLKTKQKMSTSAGKYGQKHVMTGESSNSRRRGRMKALSSTLQVSTSRYSCSCLHWTTA